MNKKEKTKNEQPKKIKRWTLHRVINTICVLFISGALILSAALFFMIHDIMSQEGQSFSIDKLVSQDSFTMYDANDEVFFDAAKDNENRESVEFDVIPQTVIDAFLSIEDSRFYTHNGFDLPRFVSSMFNNLKGFATGTPGLQGGSTLTMQVIDQFYTSESQRAEAEANGGEISTYKVLQYKILEVFLAVDAENVMSKNDILLNYLNKINFGAGAHGIQKAAEYYFGKNVSELNLSESAFLAGVINAPSSYNPYTNYDLAVQRRNATLDMMLYHGYITQEQHDLAVNTELAFLLDGEKAFDTEPYVAYADVAKEEASKLLDGRDVVGEGMQVYTYMDREAQEYADEISNGNIVDFPGNGAASPDWQFAFSLVDNSNGAIVALSNGRDYDKDPQNKQARAVNAQEPGSSMKPLIAYAPTFDLLGWSTVHTVDDKAADYYGNGMSVQNSDQKYDGPILLQDAINKSKNTTALQAYIDLEEKVGNAGMQNILRNLNFSDTVVNNAKRSFALGSGEGMEISTAELAAAYSSLANEGKSNKAHTVRKIVDKDGTVLYDAEAPENSTTKQAYSPQAAYMISTLLNNAVYSSSNMMGSAGFPSYYKIYGKTGTVGFEGLPYAVPGDAIKDNWMINYTKKYSLATWIGFDENTDKNYIERFGTLFMSNFPGSVNKSMLNYMYEHTGNPGAVSDPGGISTITIAKNTFPYQKGEGLPEELTATGLIKTEFANLADFELPKLDDLTTFNVTRSDATIDTLFTVEFKPYEKKEVDEDSDEITIESLGKDILYVVEVNINGTVKRYESKDPKFTIDLKEFAGDEDIEVTFTGYYQVEGMDIKSTTKTYKTTIRAVVPETPPADPGGEEEIPPEEPTN